MTRMLRGAAGAVLALVLAAGGGAAQSWRFDLGVNGGGAFRTASVSADNAGGEAGKFTPSWLVGSQLGVNFTPKIGLRANGAYGPSKFKAGGNEWPEEFHLWAISGDLMFRLKQAAETFTTTEMLPYIAVGAGARVIRPDSMLGVIQDNEVIPGSPVPIGSGTAALLVRRATVPMGLVGLGADIRTAKHLAFRVEVGDRIFKPLINAIPASNSEVALGDDVAKLTNELYGTLGIHLLIGMKSPPPVAVVTPTPPPAEVTPPPPTPPPPPPPPPEQAITTCVVDPTAAGGMKMVDAVFLPQTGDTMIAGAAGRQKIQEAFASNPTVNEQAWFSRGEPLVIGTAPRSVQFVAFGTPRAFAPGGLVYLGQVGGLPVFAETTPAAALDKQLTAAPTARADLGKFVAGSAAARRNLRTAGTLYVPSSRAGCYFQGMQLQEAVRKVRG